MQKSAKISGTTVKHLCPFFPSFSTVFFGTAEHTGWLACLPACRPTDCTANRTEADVPQSFQFLFILLFSGESYVMVLVLVLCYL